jgi:hypothetical protein
MELSEQALFQLVAQENIRRAQGMLSAQEQVAILFLVAGYDLKPAQLVKEFGLSRHQAERLIAKIRQQIFLAQKPRKNKPRGAQNPRPPKRPQKPSA